MSGYPIITRISPAIEIETPLGEGYAHFLWADGSDLYWGCCLKETNESWWFDNSRIRYAVNLSERRPSTSPIQPMPGLESHLKRHKKAPRRSP